MSRRLELRLKCRMPVTISSGTFSEEGIVLDISPTHFKATFKTNLSDHRRYHFKINLLDAKPIDGKARVERLLSSKEGEYSFIMLIEGLAIQEEVELLAYIQQQSSQESPERRQNGRVSSFTKNRRGGDRVSPHVEYARVVITGIGVVSPIGIGRSAYWTSILNRRSGIKDISLFDTSSFPIKIAGEVSTADVLHQVPQRLAKHMGRATMFGWLAAKLAWEDAELKVENENLDRAGVVMGTTLGTLDWAFAQYATLHAKGYKSEHPYTIAAGSSNALSGEISVQYGLRGPSLTLSQGCSSASMSIAYGLDSIRLGRTSIMLVGGSDAPLNPTVFGAFVRSGMLSKSAASLKGDSIAVSDCTGAVLGEGACVLVLESYDHAKQRGAPILGELMSTGFASDGHDMIIPHPSGRGIARAIRMSFEQGNAEKDKVDLIMGHFAGLRDPHLVEMRVLRREFGQQVNVVPVANVKPLIGYTQGACGAFEVAAACLAFQEPVRWITYNGKHSASKAHTALVNCVGFGGKNVSLLVGSSLDG